jgi:hypothetical protein
MALPGGFFFLDFRFSSLIHFRFVVVVFLSSSNADGETRNGKKNAIKKIEGGNHRVKAFFFYFFWAKSF